MYEVFFNDRKIIIAAKGEITINKSIQIVDNLLTRNDVKKWFPQFVSNDIQEVVILNPAPEIFFKNIFQPVFRQIKAAGGVVVRRKKILFIFSSQILKYIYVSFLVHFFQKLRTEENFISDTVCYDRKAKYKILTFAPDLIVTYTISAHDNALQLIRFAKKTGGCRVLSIVEKNISRENIAHIKAAGSDAVVARCININELVEKINSLFK